MLKFRSILFACYLYTVPFMIFLSLTPSLLNPRWARWTVRLWASAALWGLRVICGLSYRIEGAEHVPDGPCLIACKHQSMWETVALIPILKNPLFVMKAELLKMPIYGWWAKAARNIPVDREGRGSALRAMVRAAKERIAEGCQIIIFPEGTRVAPGETAPYQPGVAGLYGALDVPVVPAGLNSGLYWISGTVIRKPGVITIRFAPPIPPGLGRKAFMQQLSDEIEDATRALVESDPHYAARISAADAAREPNAA